MHQAPILCKDKYETVLTLEILKGWWAWPILKQIIDHTNRKVLLWNNLEIVDIRGSGGCENTFFQARMGFRGEGGRPVGVHQRKAIPVRGKRANTGRGQETMEGTGIGPRARTHVKQCRVVLRAEQGPGWEECAHHT